MQADEEIYKTIFRDQWNKFNWEGGMREDEDSDEEVFGLDSDDENLF